MDFVLVLFVFHQESAIVFTVPKIKQSHHLLTLFKGLPVCLENNLHMLPSIPQQKRRRRRELIELKKIDNTTMFIASPVETKHFTKIRHHIGLLSHTN